MGLIGTADAVGEIKTSAADNHILDAAYTAATIEGQREKILVVPGEGDVNGVLVCRCGKRFAIRDEVGGAKGVMFVDSADGWVEVDLGFELAFTAGSDPFTEGEQITATAGGGTATIDRLSYTDTGTGTTTGTMTVSNISGTIGAGTITGGTSTETATVAGAASAIELPPGGRYEFIIANFYANASAERAYGVNGVGQAFEWETSTGIFCFVQTGNTVDTPEHIEEHYLRLYLSYPTGSLQNSTAGLPLDWGTDPVEQGAGDTITGLLSTPGGTLAVFSRDRTSVLHGTQSSDWVLKNLSEQSGAIEWTISNISGSKYLDDRGVTSLVAVQAFGDFRSSVISHNVERLLESKRELAIASMAWHQKDQYRLFFSDNTGLFFTFNGRKLFGITKIKYANSITCLHHGQDSDGSEYAIFGSSDGYVYKFEEGNSFDDDEVIATLSTAYNHMKRPAYDKRFRKITIEAEASSSTVIFFQPQFNYGSGLISPEPPQSETVEQGGGYWDADNWNEFSWASDTVTLLEGNITGVGRNMSVAISSTAKYDDPHTLYGMIINYSPRRLLR